MPCLSNNGMTTHGTMTSHAAHRRRSITIPQRRRRLNRRRLSAHCVLSTVGDWEFNVFTMDNLTNGRSMFNVGLRMLQDHDLIETFNLDIVKLMRCLTLIEEGYLSSNPYHNSMHGAEVAQAMHCYLNEPVLSGHVTPLEKMISLFAALAHDVAHPGVSNAFLINTNNHLATLYNKESVLENHHWRTMMSIFHQTGLFSHLDKTTLVTIETLSKSLILATDISKQAELLNKFKAGLDEGDFSLDEQENRHLALQIAIKCADLSNTTRPWDISSRWSELVCQEFYNQGDMECKLGLPLTPLNDRLSSTKAQIQSGFMQFVVIPLYKEWQKFNPSQLSEKMLQNVESNKAEWDSIIQQTKELENKDNPEGDNQPICKQAAPPSQDLETSAEDSSATNTKAGKKRACTSPINNVESTLDNLNDSIDDCDFPDEQFLGRRRSLPLTVLNADCGFQAVPRPLAALQKIRYNASRRGSLPLSVLDSRLGVLEESPTSSCTFDVDIRDQFRLNTDSDDVDSICQDDDIVLPAITLKLLDDVISHSHCEDSHYNTKRRRSAPNTQLLLTPELTLCNIKQLSNNQNCANMSGENCNTDRQLYKALRSRRCSLPLKQKDVLNCQKKLLKQGTSLLKAASHRRRNSLPLFVLANNNQTTKQDNFDGKENNCAHTGTPPQHKNGSKSSKETDNVTLLQLKTKKPLSLQRVTSRS